MVTSSPCIGALAHSFKVQVEGERRGRLRGSLGRPPALAVPGKEVSGSLALQGRTQRGVGISWQMCAKAASQGLRRGRDLLALEF